MNRLQKILRPASIAIIGASRKEGSLGKMFLEAVLRMNYTGKIYPVNPKADEIEGIRTYPDLESLPEKPDMAIILLAYKYVLQSVEILGRAGVKDIIVISAGFKEVGGEGIEREKELIALGKKYDLNILGPNCMGVFNTDAKFSFNGTFSPTLPKAGHVAYISQSGALGVAVLELNAKTDLGFSVFVSTGNKADITDNDALEFLWEDDNSKVVTLYLESIDDPTGFGKICKKLSAKKPVLAVKAGRTASGLKAASSHTGALANPDYLADAFLKQHGVLRIDTLQELFDASRAFSKQPLPNGSDVAIVTNAGGPGILASDAVEKAGLNLAQFQERTVEQLQAFLPGEAACGNPVDMIASANEETYAKAMQTVLADENVQAVLLIIVQPPVNTTVGKIIFAMKSIVKNNNKTIIPVLMAQKDEKAGLDIFEELDLPVYSYPEQAVNVLGKMWRYKKIQLQMRDAVKEQYTLKTSPPLTTAPGNQAKADELFALLKKYNIAATPYVVSNNVEEIIRFQKEQTGKIVIKTANEEIIHKSDEGLLQLHLETEADIRSAFSRIESVLRQKLPVGIAPLFLAQKQIPPGPELVIGGKRDAQFGAVVMAGFGGIFIEVLKDVIFRFAPLSEQEALAMLDELHSQALFAGFRGQPPVDKKSFARTIQKFSLLLAEHPEISEMDLNPLIWSAQRQEAVVVDLRATLR